MGCSQKRSENPKEAAGLYISLTKDDTEGEENKVKGIWALGWVSCRKEIYSK